MGEGSAPSPLHTSDSEETFINKKRWVMLARGAVRRWRRWVVLELQNKVYLAFRKVLPSPSARAMRLPFLVDTNEIAGNQ